MRLLSVSEQSGGIVWGTPKCPHGKIKWLCRKGCEHIVWLLGLCVVSPELAVHLAGASAGVGLCQRICEPLCHPRHWEQSQVHSVWFFASQQCTTLLSIELRPSVHDWQQGPDDEESLSGRCCSGESDRGAGKGCVVAPSPSHPTCVMLSAHRLDGLFTLWLCSTQWDLRFGTLQFRSWCLYFPNKGCRNGCCLLPLL